MKDRIMQIAKGIVNADLPDLIFFPEVLNRKVPADSVITLDIFIKSKNRIPFKCFLYSDDEKVRVLNSAVSGFSGSASIEISTKNCTVSDVIKGAISFVTNAGEKKLEYRFPVTGPDGEVPVMKTIGDFCAFYRESPKKAVRLFASAWFEHFPFMEDPIRRAMYDSLRQGLRDDQELEEFLVGCGAKSRVSFALDRQNVSLEDNGADLFGAIELSASGWGYVRIHAISDMDWLIFEKEWITASDFQAGRTRLLYRIDRSRLHGGKNSAFVTLKGDISSCSCTVEVVRKKISGGCSAEKKEMVSGLYRMLLDYLNGSYEEEVITASLDRTLEGWIKKYPGEVSLYLFRAWILVKTGRKEEAGALLNWCSPVVIRQRRDFSGRYCVYLYLDSEVHEEAERKEQAFALIHKHFQAMPDPVAALLELYLLRQPTDEEIVDFLDDLETAYGSCPLVLALAAAVYRRNPSVMKANSVFMLHTVNYMVHYQCLGENTVSRFLSLLSGTECGKNLQLRILMRLYEQKKETAVLTAICGLLMRQGRTGSRYVKWYEEGIRKEVRLTSIHEYYLASFSFDRELPIDILLYYSCKNELDEETKLKLYTYILQHYGKGTEMYLAYREQMSQFAAVQLLKGKISPGLVMLYEDFLEPGMIDRRLAGVLPDLLYAKKITTQIPSARKVIIRYPQLCQDFSQTMEGQTACVPVYPEYSVILFEDGFGNRFADADCQAEPLMFHKEYVDVCRKYYPNQLMFILEEICPLYRREIETEEEYVNAGRLMLLPEINDAFRMLLTERRIRYCLRLSRKKTFGEANSGAFLDEESDKWLLSLQLSNLKAPVRTEVIELYILRGYVKDAFRAVKSYSCIGLPTDLLLKMTVRCIMDRLYEYDAYLVFLGEKLIQSGQWNETLLIYLAQHFNGTTQQMMKLLQICTEEKAESRDLAERVVAQMMFTGETKQLDEAFDIYRNGARMSALVLKAYYVLKCHECMLQDGSLSDRMAGDVEMILLQEGKDRVPKVFWYVLLRSYAKRKELGEEQKKLCESLIYDLCESGIYPDCCAALGKKIEMPRQMEGKKVISCHAEAGALLHIKGKFFPAGEECRIPLSEIYPGVYTGIVLLFPDERIEGTIVSEKDGRVTETEKTVIYPEDSYVRSGSRFDRISQAVRMEQKEDYEGLKQLTERYEREKLSLKELFPMI